MVKKIFTYWHQGFDIAPKVVQECVHRMRLLHPQYDIYLLDNKNVGDFIDALPVKEEVLKKLSLPHRSDLIRTQILVNNGGVWLDPTVFCMQPMEEWLKEHMEAGIFLFHRPGRDRIIANWFIAAEKDNYMLKRLYEALVQYWNSHDFRNLRTEDDALAKWAHRWINGRSLALSQVWLSPIFTKLLRIYPYMIYHFMFYHLIQTDQPCREIYEAMPKFSAEAAHLLQREGLVQPLSPKAKEAIDKGMVPLFKLKWKLEPDKVSAGSNLDYLLQRTK